MTSKFRLLLSVLLLLPVTALAQVPSDDGRAGAGREPMGVLPDMPWFAIKTNLLYDATSTINFGFEFRVSKSLTLDLSGNLNPWTFKDNQKLKHILVQPELRHWIYEPFNGHFLGVHAIWSVFNFGNLDSPYGMREALGFANLKDYRYEGNIYGIGLSYGYQWMLSNRFSIEATAGFGYAYVNYDKFRCEECGEELAVNQARHYFGPTKLGLSLIFIID
jgi:hypothetical protein